jgi:hypothetical protein
MNYDESTILQNLLHLGFITQKQLFWLRFDKGIVNFKFSSFSPLFTVLPKKKSLQSGSLVVIQHTDFSQK